VRDGAAEGAAGRHHHEVAALAERRVDYLDEGNARDRLDQIRGRLARLAEHRHARPGAPGQRERLMPGRSRTDVTRRGD
jgi:hypothetical protein